MKRLVLAVVLSGVVFAAAAQTPVAEPATQVADSTVSTETPVANGEENVAANAKPSSSNCIQQTGSRIRVKNQSGKCNGEPGSAYSREDIRGTGRADLGEALRTLDTSIF